MEFIYGGVIGILLIYHAFTEYVHRKEVNKLLNRIMSRDFGEYKYYEQKYPKDLKTVDQLRKQETKQSVKEQEISEAPPPKNVQDFMKGLEEDWEAGEIDESKVPKEGE